MTEFMVQYINKSALVAEIERLRELLNLNLRHDQGVCDGLYVVQKFLNTLEVKEVDLEKEFYDFFYTFIGKDYGHLSEYELFRIAEYFYELGLKAKEI